MKDIKKFDSDNYIETETIDRGETYYLEEELYVDENSTKNKSLVRVDINIILFPIFSKNTRKRKNEIITYYFNYKLGNENELDFFKKEIERLNSINKNISVEI